MTGPIQHIITTIDTMITAMDNAGTSSANMFSPSDIYSMHTSLDTALAQVNEITDAMEREESAQRQVNNTIRGQNNALSGVIKQAGVMAGGYLGLQGIIKATKTAINFSDELTNNTSRLNLMNDGLQTTEELQNKIFNYANDARTSYSDMMTTVAALGQGARDAFSSNDETIQFASNLAKEFAIAGASQEEQASATLQLTQALGSGVLRGEELNAVFEAAPNVIQTIADYLEVPIGQIRSMASNGEITADIVKNAMLGATDSINAEFASTSTTVRQHMTRMGNYAAKAFEPVGRKINKIANSKEIEAVCNNIIGAFNIAAQVASVALDVISEAGSFVFENWEIIAPLVAGATIALGIYCFWLGITKGLEAAAAIQGGLLAISRGLLAAATVILTGTTWAQVIAQRGLNGAMYACPIVWIIGLFIALIAIFYAMVAWTNKMQGTTISATGIICGAIAAGVAFAHNQILGIFDVSLTVANLLHNTWAVFANFFSNVFNSPISSIIYLFRDLAQTVLSILNSIASAIDNIFGSNLSDAVNTWIDGADSLANKAVEKFAGNENYQKQVDVWKLTSKDFGMDRWAYKDAYNGGYQFGQSVDTAIDNVFNIDDYLNKKAGDNYNRLGLGAGNNDAVKALDSTAKNTSTIGDYC